MMSLTLADLEQLQTDHPEWQMELVEGSIIVMGPCDYISDEIGTRLSRFLGNWIDPRRLGRVTGSSAGFILPNSDLRAPDVSFVRAEKLRRSQRDFVELVPDLVVEIKSTTDRIKPFEEKVKSFISLGTQVGILIDPDRLTLTVYRSEGAPQVFQDGDILTSPELFPGWELPISDLWPPVFE